MVDSIKNMNTRINVHTKNENKVAINPSNSTKVNASKLGNADTVDVRSNAGAVAALELAKSPHMDSEAVNRIKQAISNGNYPVDVDRVTDALMDAYMEFKS
jgi:negative regulator of flagellin synthesis FlgM